MVYCTTADVQNFFLDITFTDASKVTLTDVADIITEKSDYLDGRLKGIYQTPITGSQSLSIVKHCVEHLCASEIWARMRPAGLPREETNWAWSWNKEAEAMITRIVGPTADPREMVELPDAVALAGKAERHVAGLVDSGVADLGSSDSGYSPMFSTGDVF